MIKELFRRVRIWAIVVFGMAGPLMAQGLEVGLTSANGAFYSVTTREMLATSTLEVLSFKNALAIEGGLAFAEHRTFPVLGLLIDPVNTFALAGVHAESKFPLKVGITFGYDWQNIGKEFIWGLKCTLFRIPIWSEK